MRISDWSSDVCSSDLVCTHCSVGCTVMAEVQNGVWIGQEPGFDSPLNLGAHCAKGAAIREHVHGERRLKRSEEHTSELQSLMRISYAVFCLKKKKKHT